MAPAMCRLSSRRRDRAAGPYRTDIASTGEVQGYSPRSWAQEGTLADGLHRTSAVMDVRMHDGSTVRLRKVSADYDPIDRDAAYAYVRARQREGEVCTGMLTWNRRAGPA